MAAAHHWNDVTTRLFAQADYHHHPDPLQRILSYLNFRAALAESPPLLWSFLYFFCLLSGYYVLRPVREAMGAP